MQKHVKSLRTLSQGFCVFKGLHGGTWSRYNQQVQLHKLMLGIIRACSRNCMHVLTSDHAIPFSFHPSDILLKLTKLGLLQLLWLQAGSSGSKLFRSYCVAHVFGERPKMGIDTKVATAGDISVQVECSLAIAWFFSGLSSFVARELLNADIRTAAAQLRRAWVFCASSYFSASPKTLHCDLPSGVSNRPYAVRKGYSLGSKRAVGVLKDLAIFARLITTPCLWWQPGLALNWARYGKIGEFSPKGALARLLLHKVLVVDHTPVSALQDSMHVITIHVFRVTIHKHVLSGRPFQHGIGLCQNKAQPCHCECQGFLSSIRRCVRRSRFVGIFGVSLQSQRDRTDSIQSTALIHRIAQEAGKETTAENADVCSFFGSLEFSRVCWSVQTLANRWLRASITVKEPSLPESRSRSASKTK